MRLKLIMAIIVCLMITAPLHAADAFNDVPLPQTLQLQGKAPAALTARAWRGRWRNPAAPAAEGLNAILIIEKVAGNKADIIYAYGNYPELQIKPGWARYKVALVSVGKKLKFSFTSKLGHALDFELEGDKLTGSMRGRNVKIAMTPYQLKEK